MGISAGLETIAELRISGLNGTRDLGVQHLRLVDSFGRHDAQFMLTATAAALWDALGINVLSAPRARTETPV